MPPIDVNAALLESWELSLRSPLDGGKPKRPRTIALYLDEARRFVDWLDTHGRTTDLEAVARTDVAAWIADLRAAGRSASTVRSRWIALRNLYGWAHAEDIVAANPLAGIVVAKADEPPPDVLDDDTIRALLKACQGTAFGDRRDFALLRFMLATGLRVSEVVGVRLDELDLTQRLAYIGTDTAKGGKTRYARFDPTTAAALDRYRRARGRHRLANRPELWLGHRGPLTRKGLPTILDKRSALAGVGHVHAHQLRHTFAHKVKKAGLSDESVMALGGWADSASLRRYGEHLRTERALAAYDEADPMSGL